MSLLYMFKQWCSRMRRQRGDMVVTIVVIFRRTNENRADSMEVGTEQAQGTEHCENNATS